MTCLRHIIGSSTNRDYYDNIQSGLCNSYYPLPFLINYFSSYSSSSFYQSKKIVHFMFTALTGVKFYTLVAIDK